MISDDELRSGLHDLADHVDVATVSLEQVQARGRRRTMYQRGAVVLAAFALVVGGTVAITSITGDGSEGDVATDRTDANAVVSVDDDAATSSDETSADGASDEDGLATTTTLPPATATSESDFASEGPAQVVAWGDGFLSIGSGWVETASTALASEFGSSEVASFFPSEIIEAIEGVGDVSLDSNEVEAALEDAGVIQEASAIVEENPEVFEWFTSNMPGGRSVAFAEFSEDGSTWEAVDGFAWPGNQSWAPQFVSNGTHLVAVVQDFPGTPGQQSPDRQQVTVYTTDDLVTWTGVELPLERPAVADHVQAEFSPGQIAIDDDGWYVTVGFWQWIDLWAALPAEVQAEVDEFGYGWNPTPDGIEIQDWSSFEEASAPATTVPGEAVATSEVSGDGGGPVTIRTVPWSELPFTYDDYLATTNSEGGGAQQAFVGGFDGEVASATLPGDGSEVGQVVATDGGFFMTTRDFADTGFERDGFEPAAPAVRAYTSTDGRQWSEVVLDLPSDVWIDTIASVDGGILAVTSGPEAGQQFYLGSADGSSFRAVDGPDVGDAWVWFSNMGSRDGVASVVDFGQSTNPEWVAWTAAFTYDGYDIEIVATESGEQSLTVELDGEVLLDRSALLREGQVFDWVDAGIQITSADLTIDIPFDVAEAEIFAKEHAAWEAAWEANPYVADYRLIVSRDGRNWSVIELPSTSSEFGWYGQPAINGDTVVVTDDLGNTLTYPVS